MENNLKEIKDFINQWKVRAIDYYNNALVEYKKEKSIITKRKLELDRKKECQK